MLNNYSNQWSRASFIYSQLDEKDILEYKIVMSIVDFIKNKFKLKKKPA